MSASATERLRPQDNRLILICLFICAASLFCGFRFFYRAFPEASIQFNVDRDSSEPLARNYLAAQGLSVAGYQHAAAFVYDEEAKVFLERELGLAKANDLMRTEVKIWRWGHRWFRPLEKEEVRIEVTTGGEIASFLHILPEEAPGADLPPDTARSLAESFVSSQAGRPLRTLEFLDARSQRRTYRTDYFFTWKVRGADYAGASNRISVTIQGAHVDGYRDDLKIPEEWSRSYTRLRSLNESTSQLDLVFFALLGIAMLVALGRHARLRDVRWTAGLTFGIICFILQFLAAMNEFPLAKYGFDTADSYRSFIGISILSATFEALGFGGIIALLTAAVEPLYRQSYPTKLSIPKILSWQALRTRGFFRAVLVGITLTFFFFAFEIGFYLVANRLGAWAPAEVPYSNLLNTHFPWIFVLLGGFFPAVSEEWMFRAFSIPFLQGLFRRRWLAIILAAFIWGFGHANYPNQPFYIRGIEVGLVGLVLSWAMLRFGILAPLIAHYSIDAFYSAFLLLRSGNSYMVTAGALTAGISLVPLLVAAGAYLVTRRFRADDTVSNAMEGSAAAAESMASSPLPDEIHPYVPLSRKAIWIAAATLAAGLLLFLFRSPHFGDSGTFRLSAGQAAQFARRFLAAQQFDMGAFQQATQPVARIGTDVVQYVYFEGGIDGLNRIYGHQVVPVVWQTRFFRPLQQEEFQVNVDPGDGRVVGFDHALPEEAPGADLPTKEAQILAASFLEQQGYNLSHFELQETRSEKLERRRDTTLVWQAMPSSSGAIGDARLRIQTEVAGDRMGSWIDYIKIPEEWQRMRARLNLYAIMAILARTTFLGLMLAAATWILVQGIRRGDIRWALAIRTSLLVMLLELFYMLDLIPAFRFRYDTQIPQQIFVLSGFVEAALRLIGIGLAGGLAAAIVMACYPEVPGFLLRKNRAAWGRDAWIASAATLGGFLALQWITTFIQFHASRYSSAPEVAVSDSLGGYIPCVASLRNILLSALLFSTILAFGAHLWTRLAGRTWLRTLLIAGLFGSFLPFGAKRFTEIALETGLSAVLILLTFLIVAHYLRANYAAYFMATAVLSTAHESFSFLGQGNTLLEFQGWLLWLFVLGCACFFFPICRWKRSDLEAGV